MPTRIDKLTPEQEARLDEWADRWIEIGLRTGPADRDRFEAACEVCYGYAGIPWHGNVVWTTSPLAVAFAGPLAMYVLRDREAVRGAVREAVDEAVDGAVDGAVREAVREAVDEAVDGAVDGAVREAVGAAVGEAVREAVGAAVREAVGAAVGEAVREAVGAAVGAAVGEAVGGDWWRYLGGQFWVGGWYWGGAWTSYFREVCDLDLPGDLWDRARAYEATIESACWWWPHRQFVVVSERPLVIHRELVDPTRPRGWGSHRLHCADGPAVVWPDGWGVWAWHGVRVPQRVIEQPDTLTSADILGEQNLEVRRAMLEIVGYERVLDAGKKIADDSFGELYRIPQSEDEDIWLVGVRDPSTERRYLLRCDPNAYGGLRSARAAVASTWRNVDGSLVFEREEDYVLAAES